MALRYRAEIDGLRALAVVPVILYHAGFGLFSGGFTGVDVFFVISGYLITGILLEDFRQGRFSLAAFYERRARRILPALFTVILVSLPVAYILMPPPQLADFGASLVTALLALSNIYFLSQIDYFAPSAELQPLLHTWSLAIEEQYYLLFPLFLIATHRLHKRSATLVLCFLVLGSFVFAEWAWRENAARSFYFTLSRFWEIGAGSICAFLVAGKEQRPNEGLAGAGLALVLLPIFFFDATVPFPSVYTLAPVTGTALILLYATQGTRVARLLSMRGPVAIGLMSYSAYLWHQPVFAFARIESLSEPGRLEMAFLTALSLGLAWLTWRYVERPFRSRDLLATRRCVFVASGLVGAALIATGLAGFLSNGLEYRLTPLERQMLAESRTVSFTCADPDGSCLLGDAAGSFSGVLFAGDSHASRYGYLLNERLAATGTSARFLSNAWCAPLLDWQSRNEGKCGGQDFGRTFAGLVDDDTVHTVVLAAEWANYTTGYRAGSNTSAFDFTGDGITNDDAGQNATEFAKAFSATLSALRQAGKRVILIAPVPEYDFDVPSAALRLAGSDGDRSNFALTRQQYDLRNAAVFAAFDARPAEVQLVDVWPLLCAAEICLPFDARGFARYSDMNHLSTIGMQDIIDEMIRQLDL